MGNSFQNAFDQGLKILLKYELLYMVNNAFRMDGEINNNNNKKTGTSFIKMKYSHCADINNI